MKTRIFPGIFLSMSACILACQPAEVSHEKVTSVSHTAVKRQSIGNCWLYAQATWLESMLKSTTGENVNVSETYWTYWDMYNKLLENQPIPEDELNTGGTWSRSVAIISKYGWVKEDEFIPEETNLQMSKSQACAEDYIMAQGKEGGTLFDVSKRTPELLRAEKLPTEAELTAYKKLEQRIKLALNDHQPVVLSWFVSFNAANDKGLFNLGTLASKRELGSSGGHMIVLHDYVVNNVPGRGTLGEGEMSDEDKALALEGDLDYFVVKNSWGANRADRPWLANGYSRLSWDYLTNRYENEDVYSTFIRGVVLPPGY
ncbi:MAG: hypothetical protein EOP07_07085 [Proteobacteria bacterium]|nr:MAG: hypothetical protein EOP07_07085 [Pseudomonadota bacterium]